VNEGEMGRAGSMNGENNIGFWWDIQKERFTRKIMA
jgi:hypothetical protein